MKNKKIFFSLFAILVLFCAVAIFSFFLSRPSREIEKIEKIEEIKENASEENGVGSVSLPTVIIDAGHGGEDGGAIGVNGAYEKDINLAISLKLKEKLDALGIPCALTRSEDILLYDRNTDFEGRKKKLDLQYRKDFAESYENAIFISVHQNSFSEEKYSGLQIYYSRNDKDSQRLALTVESAIKKELQKENSRASKEASSSIYLLDKLYCPAILIECGFISNKEECARLCDESYQNELCEIISDSVRLFLTE